ncbi:unnamed protein product [Lymnaea stagnalis]|uniref:Uncharacterized protein n=1 Tax=Lymnaea stagnalis TaxID=6523 RepID=A0AAV2HLK8_LYMST
MSASQFDDLLGDFGETSNTTTTKSTSNGNLDDFDPFGPSGAVQSSGGGDSGLLLDFSVATEIRNGESSNGVDFQFDTSASGSANPHYSMSDDETQSSNPLYNLSSSGPANPLYDLSMGEDDNQSANPLYDLTTETSQPSNPLYDFEDSGTTDDTAQQSELFYGTNQDQPDDLLGEDQGNDQEEEEEDSSLQQEEYDPVVLNGDPKHWVQQQETEEDQLQYDRVEIVEEVPRNDGVEQAEAENQEQFQEEIHQFQEESQEQAETESQEQAETESQAHVEVEKREERQEECYEQSANIPSVEITQSPEPVEEDFGQEEHPAEELDSGDQHPEEATGGQDRVANTASGHHDMLTPDSYGHDRREEDLEHYCMDREESDLMEEQDSPEAQNTLKPRNERSRSPSRSMGPDTPEERNTPEENYSSEDPDLVSTLRPREDRSQAPSRSLEPEEPARKAEEEEIIQDGRSISRTSRTENRYSDSGLESTQVSSNQWEDQQNSQNVEHNRQTEQDIVHFSEMSSVKNKFEAQPPPSERRQVDIKQEVLSAEGGVYESQPQAFQQWQNEEEEEEGVYESQPVRRDDVVREADKDITADLPPVGTAQSIRAKFLSGATQDSAPRKREMTPPAHGAGGEYVSEPRGYVERYEGKAESGVFESQPVVNPDVVTSSTTIEDAKPEHGFAKNVAAKFKELESKGGSYTPSSKRELTPDRSGRVEYVSEPRGQVERYEGKAESGVFESQPAINPDVVRSGEEIREELPERGMAKNIAQKFRQISTDNSSSSVSRGKREITPDRSGRVEYVSEPRGHSEQYEVKVDAGVFENTPQRNPDVVTSESSTEEFLPERGFAKNVAAKFKVLESSVKSPPLSPGRRKEFTPPREEERAKQSVVLENNPEYKNEVVHSGDQLEEKLPERGTAKNMAQRFKQLESESKLPGSPRAKKEFTPPPHDSGVYENQPKQFHADYNRPAESGILENNPVVRDDVVKGSEPPRYEEELPERGTAKNMVNKWRQMESGGNSRTKSPGSSGRPKEFTPPREEPRIVQQRKSPRTPLSPSGYDQLDNGSVHPRDLPGQYQPLNEASVFESTPEVRQDAAREADTDWTEGMPKKDTAKKMLAKFQHIQEEAKKQSPQPVTRKVGTAH